jgi:hypothetical protein
MKSDGVQSDRQVPTFHSNLPPPYSGQITEQASPKHWYLSTKLQGVTAPKTIISIKYLLLHTSFEAFTG